MKYIDHHAHMVSRTTDDYQQLALTGCVAVTEPAFWAGWDRSTAQGMEDYFRQLTEFEPQRAGQYHIQHYTWMAMNPKESDDRALSREVLARIPKFLDRPTVLGIGEIGLNRITRNEIDTYTEQVELAMKYRQLILIHTPHLEDKLKGTKISVDVLKRVPGIDPGRVLVDHAEADEGLGRARRGHHRAVRRRAHVRRRRLRLGSERSDRGAAFHHGDAAPPPSGRVDPPHRLRESRALPQSIAEVPHTAGGAGRTGTRSGRPVGSMIT
jgi:hypothetical protein